MDAQLAFGYQWPEHSNIVIEGFKYTLTVSIENIEEMSFFFGLKDEDEFVIELDQSDVCQMRDWIMTNVIPNYLKFPQLLNLN